MKMRDFRCFLLVCLLLCGLLSAMPAPCVAADAPAGLPGEIQELLGTSPEAPVFTDLGGGFHSLSIALRPEMRERLLAALGTGEATGKAAQTLFVLSAGQAPTSPSNPIATTHGVLSDTTFGYNYWLIVLNLGNQNVTRTTTVKLTGPGLKFNKSVQATYPAGALWVIGYSPGRGVGTPGIYTYQATVAGGGSITTKSFAVRP